MMAYAIIFATLLGPVLAVQAQRWVDIQREKHARRLAIFRTLMATRAASLSPQHVEALNAIPIEFYGNKKSFQDVITAWKAYLDYLGRNDVDPNIWAQRRQDLFIDLLLKLSKSLKYKFSNLELQKEVYSPIHHERVGNEQEVIRQGMYRLFSGELALPLDIKSFPTDPDTIQMQSLLQKSIYDVIANGAVKVEVSSTNNKPDN